MNGFGDRLTAAIASRGPLCLGIDPHPELLRAWGLGVDAEGLARFSDICVQAFGGFAVVKPQVAFFEAYGSAGYAVLENTIAALRDAHAAETSRLREAQPAAPAAPPASKDAADLAQENEDLLVLLDELSTKHKRNKERMRLQGWDVSDDDDDDDDDEL